MSHAGERPRLKSNVEAFERDAAGGRYVYTTPDRLSSVLSNQRMSRAIHQAVNVAGQTVLDIGCGDGTYTMELARAGARMVVGVDPAPAAVALAQERSAALKLRNVSYLVGDVYSLPRDERFDVAVFRGVLHHLDDAALAVRLAAASCRSMVILEPNGWNPLLKVIEKVSPYHRHHEEQSFTPFTIRQWVRAAGGRVVSVDVINLVPMFCPSVMARGLKVVEPLVERVPLVRTALCGQVVLRAEFS